MLLLLAIILLLMMSPKLKLFISLFPILKKIATINARFYIEKLEDSIFISSINKEKTVHLGIYFDNFDYGFFTYYENKKMISNGSGPIDLLISEINYHLGS